jgi:glyoxylase-like metal-dependent hydrolase (beta-lactamase superfamily II)
MPSFKNFSSKRYGFSTSRLRIPMGPFLQPDYTGHPDLLGPSFSFLITHPTRKPILFDLGVRTDWQVLPSYPKWVELKWEIKVEKDVATILKDHGYDVDSGAIESIIWSHHHWDHVGDASTFPGSTEVVVGPGFKEAHTPGWPVNKEATLMQSDFEGRQLREVDFEQEGKGLKIGRFNAIDYFGDGSCKSCLPSLHLFKPTSVPTDVKTLVYLLDTPGHSVGHICALARTTTEPTPTFIFMGGDASHHGGEFRPTPYLPLPKEFNPSPLKELHPKICPGHLLQEIHPNNAADKPFYHVTESFAHDKKVADWTIDGLGEFDAHENVLLLLAHDDAVVDPALLDFFPKEANDWYQKGLGRKVKWMFLGDFEEAVEQKGKGGEGCRWGKYP